MALKSMLREATLTNLADPGLKQQASWRLDIQDQRTSRLVWGRTFFLACGRPSHGLSSVHICKERELWFLLLFM